MNKLTAAWMMVFSSVSLAAGFQLDLGGARATGMGSAVTAAVSDPSAIYFNPAGLAGRKGLSVTAGIALVMPSVNFTHLEDGGVTGTTFTLSTPPNLHLAFGITEDLSVGLGVFVPFGASTNWPAGWEGESKAKSSSVQTFDFNPTVAYQLHPRVKIGLGLQVVRGTVRIERGLNFVDSRGAVVLGGGAWGPGWNAGIQVEVVEKRVRIGASYRGPVTLKFTGQSHFTDIPVEFAGLLKDQPISADVTLPAQANFGLSITPIEKLRLGLDFKFTEWRSFDQLAINFENPALTNPLEKSWQDQVSAHLGAEYDVSSSVSARMGLVYDPTPSPAGTLTPDLPDSTRVKVCAGIGWKHDSGFGVDVGYQFVVLVGAKSTAPGFEGNYGGTAQVVALNLGFAM